MGKKTSKLHCIKPCINGKAPIRIRIGHNRLTHGHLMSRNNQQPTCGNAACGKRRLTIKPLPTRLSPVEGQQKETQYPE